MNVNVRSFCRNRNPGLLPALTVSALVSCATHAGEFKPTWIESGMETKMRGYRPMSIVLSNTAPAALKRVPEGMASPLYGVFQTGPDKAPLSHPVIAITKDSIPVKLFVDANADGEMSNDEALAWTGKEFERPDGEKATNYFSEATVKLNGEGKRGLVKFYYPIPTADTPVQATDRKYMVFYTDFGVVGEIRIGERTLSAVLTDPGATTEFALSEGMRCPLAWIDVNADGKPGGGEVFPASRPFEVDGKWWAITNLTPSGGFQLTAATKPVATPAKRTGPDLSPGKKAPQFTAKQMDGKTVKFPDDYRGRVVLVDFWAIWCGPCVAEIPNVVKNYEQYHGKGLEVLGISLDREGSEDKIAKFTESKKMPWPQVYDGKFWSAEVAKLYGISAIPHMLLVDGETGLIVANKDIRGEMLGEAIQKALDETKQ